MSYQDEVELNNICSSNGKQRACHAALRDGEWPEDADMNWESIGEIKTWNIWKVRCKKTFIDKTSRRDIDQHVGANNPGSNGPIHGTSRPI